MGVYPDGSSKRLEKHTVQTRTGGSVLVAGFAVNKAKTKYSSKVHVPTSASTTPVRSHW